MCSAALRGRRKRWTGNRRKTKFRVSSTLVCLLCKLEQRLRQMAVTRGVIVQIVLMILLRRIEVLQGKFLHSQGLRIVLLLFLIHFFDNGQILRVCIVDTCTIACSFIVPLLVQACRVDGLEKHPQQELKADHLGIV